MQTRLNPYLAFDGNAREAMEYYQTVFGGNLDMTSFKDGGMPYDPSEGDKTMHAMLEADNGIVFMASDKPAGMPFTKGTNMSMSLSGDNEAELRGYWEKLADGGAVAVPLEKAPWGDTFGMLTDKFGVDWMVNIAGRQA